MPLRSMYGKDREQRLPPASTALPFPSKQHRQVVVHASSRTGGLVLRPFDGSFRHSYNGPAVKVAWGRDGQVESLNAWEATEEDGTPFVVQGVAGLLRGFHDSFLLLIVDSSVAAAMFDPTKAIHVVTSLVAVPLDPVTSATVLAQQIARQASWRSSDVSTSEAESDDGEDEEGVSTDGEGLAVSVAASESGSEAPDADARPMRFPVDANGTVRMAKRPFWRPLFTKPKVKAAADSPVGVEPSIQNVATPPAPSALLTSEEPPLSAIGKVPDQGSDKDTVVAQKDLDFKVVNETLHDLKGMYFSSNIDITHSLQHKYEIAVESSSGGRDGVKSPAFIEPLVHLPLWRRADRRFFWNAHLSGPFIEAGLHSYVVVLQQGFVQQASISLPIQTYSTLDDPTPAAPDATSSPSITLNMTIISRRSIERPGLRYQRRGINVEGGVANAVETEFIVAAERDGKHHVASFVQTRGSIPVFWGQSPWALKPPPFLERTQAESNVAMKKHFEKLTKLYGRQLVVNLAEVTGKEAVVVDAFREGVAAIAMPNVKYTQWDFHTETKGMHYENITSKLIPSLQADLDDISYFWAAEDQVFATQSGAPRVNCIDSLDRSNVVLSAISRYVLNRHLVHLGISSHEEAGLHDQLDLSFNGLWADNGDAISREYAGTSALKGDFTRTGKRNLRGALNDASNSVSRLLLSTTTDFFKQATIDYVLGRNLNVFSEFQARLEASDPGELLRIAQIRTEAIETSAHFVINDGEEQVSGWTLLAPVEQDTVRSSKYEEKILLVSTKALYVVSYEYTLQKVVSFTRIPLGDVVSINHGAYFLSALDPAARDARDNYGFTLSFSAARTTERVQTYSMRVKVRRPSQASLPGEPEEDDVHFFAFKALRQEAVRLGVESGSHILKSTSVAPKDAKSLVNTIVSRVQEECEKVGALTEQSAITEKDIVSLAEAEAQTSILDKLGHKLQSLIWL